MSLTNRQLEILKNKKNGLSNKEIADKLGVSEPYISQTLRKISNKISNIEDSFKILSDLGEITGFAPILTEEGRISPNIPDWITPIKPRFKTQKIYFDDLVKWHLPNFNSIKIHSDLALEQESEKIYEIKTRLW